MARMLIAALLIFGTGCKSEPARPVRTERERDSIIGQSKLPGAQGVRGAMRAGDTAVAHNVLRDSLAREP
jgi:hypothetical protein